MSNKAETSEYTRKSTLESIIKRSFPSSQHSTILSDNSNSGSTLLFTLCMDLNVPVLACVFSGLYIKPRAV